MVDTVRRFIIETVLRDYATGPLNSLLDMAKQLARTFDIRIQVRDAQATRQLKELESTAKSVAGVDTSKPAKGHRAHSQEAKNLKDVLKDYGEQAKKAVDITSNFFSHLDAGRLVTAGATAGLIAYAKAVVDVYQAQRINLEMIDEFAGAQSGALKSFAAQGALTPGTSVRSRAAMEAYMAMVGFDPKQIPQMVRDTEKVMNSELGTALQGVGIKTQQDLIRTLSGPISQTSDIGRIIQHYMPEFFQPATLQTKILQIRHEKGWEFRPQELVEAEARRRLASEALERIGGQVKPNTYRIAMQDMTESFMALSSSIGQTLAPAAEVLMKFLAMIMKMISAAPEVSTIVAAILAVGTAMTVLGAILPLVTAGFTALTASMLANPITLIIAGLVTLAILLSALESRFHIFSTAWKAFSESEIGKDLINGVLALVAAFGEIEPGLFEGMLGPIKALADIIMSIFGQIDELYKMIKSGDIMGALTGSMKFAISLSPMDILVGFIDALLPLNRVQNEALNVLRSLKNLWDGFVRWLSSIWDSINALLEPIRAILKIFTGIGQILQDAILGALSHIPGLESLEQYTTGGKKRTAEAASYGVKNWQEGKVGLETLLVNPSISDQEVLSKLREAMGGKPSLSGAERYEFSKNYPDLMQYMQPGTVIYVTPEEAVSKYGVPESILPPRPVTVGTVWKGLTEPPITPEVAEANDWINNKIYHNPTKNTVNPYPALHLADLEDDKVYQNITGSQPLSGRALKSVIRSDEDLKNWYDPEAEPLGEFEKATHTSSPLGPVGESNSNINTPQIDISSQYSTAGEKAAAEVAKGNYLGAAQKILGMDVGGEILRSGLVYAHEGEPIVPAEVARSSVLIERLREIAGGQGGTPNIQINLGGIHIDASNSKADPYDLGRAVAEAIERKLSDFELMRKIEETVSRASRAYYG